MTSHHVTLVKLAYESGFVREALPVLDKTIVFFPGMSSSSPDRKLRSDLSLFPAEWLTVESGLTRKLSSSLVLQYELLSGMCYMQLRAWRPAFQALERAVTFPTRDGGCSKIMVEAHNKWVLVGVLAQGKAPTMPPMTSNAASKLYATLGRPYTTLARAFEEPTAERLKAEVHKANGGGSAFWAEQKNVGLVAEVVAHYQRWQILHLRDVYSNLGLEQVRARTQSAETGAPLSSVAAVEALLGAMMADGMLDGHVEKPADGSPPYLVFHEPEPLSEARFVREMEAAAAGIRHLEPGLRITHERLATSKEYVRHLAREARAQKDQGPHGGGMDAAEDEDLMTDVMAS